MQLSRRTFISASATLLTSGIGCDSLHETILGGANITPNTDLDLANNAFLKGDYQESLAKFTKIAARHPNDPAFKLAVAANHLQLGAIKDASSVIRNIEPAIPEDSAFCALIHAKAGEFEAAQRLIANVTWDDIAADIELLEAMALSAAKQGDQPAAWHYYRLIQKYNPSSSAIDRLAASGKFSFTREWFGTDLGSFLNYTKGISGGVIDWGVDLVKGLWEIVRHPIRTVEQTAKGIAKVLTGSNKTAIAIVGR